MANQGTMMQYFHWDLPANGTLWNRVANEADNLAAAGITALWLPPPTKAASASDVGYGAYDLWDLGEFDQKGSVRTKYGTRAELEAAVRGAHAAGLKVYLDVIFNHKGGADATERVRATPVNPDNRNQTVGEEREIETWTVFDGVFGTDPITGVVTGRLTFAGGAEAVGKFFAVIREELGDGERGFGDQSFEKAAGRAGRLVLEDFHVDPAGGAINGDEQIRPLSLVRHLGEVFDIDVDEARIVGFEGLVFGLVGRLCGS